MGRGIRISNEKKRDAEVAFEGGMQQSKVRFVLSDGSEKENIKLLKSTLNLSEESLVDKYGDLRTLGEAIIETDPEIDMEILGKKIGSTHKLYLNKNNRIAYRVNMVQVIKNPDGSEKERKDFTKVLSNVAGENLVQWSGRKFPKNEAIRKFVFIRQYQIKHINSLTYDFLYGMAKDLYDSNSLMMVGAGAKGQEALRFSSGGNSYRGFLEGRIDGDKYCLILHLTNVELKNLDKNGDL